LKNYFVIALKFQAMGEPKIATAVVPSNGTNALLFLINDPTNPVAVCNWGKVSTTICVENLGYQA